MPVEKLPKFDAARTQLDAAAAAYLRGEYVPAITLAAAAEEVLARLIPAGHVSSQEELVNLLVDRVGITPKEARDQYLNGVRNALKHHSDTAESYIELDPQVDAKVWIVRGMNNYLKISRDLPPSLKQFVDKYEPQSVGAQASNKSPQVRRP